MQDRPAQASGTGFRVPLVPMDTLLAMRQALALALSVRGTTRPNPAVGALVFDADGRIVGRGATQPPGGRHAEIVALEEAGPLAAGGTLAVTLEPCVAFPGKRTPACSQAIVQAGIRKVVVGSLDPNPQVRGQGLRTLTDAGIETLRETMGGEVEACYEGFGHFLETGRPRVTLKIARSRDGMATGTKGAPTAITGPEARIFTHRLRALSDFLLIGKGTLLSDDPELTVRDSDGPSPHRLVLWSGPLPRRRSFKVWRGGPTSFAGIGDRPEGLPESVEWISLPDAASPLSSLISHLGKLGAHELFVEPGPGLLAGFLKEGCWDRLWILDAPIDLPGGHAFDPHGLLPCTEAALTRTLGRDLARLHRNAQVRG